MKKSGVGCAAFLPAARRATQPIKKRSGHSRRGEAGQQGMSTSRQSSRSTMASSHVGAVGGGGGVGLSASASTGMGMRSSSEIATHGPTGEPIPLSEQLMQVDQAITRTLQEIDANFARCHQTITGKILPSIRQYGVASHNTWQGAKFWHRFFETASDINLVPTYEGEDEEEDGTTTTTLQEPSYTLGREEVTLDLANSPHVPRRQSGAEGDVQGNEIIGDDSGVFHEDDLDLPRSARSKVAADEEGKGKQKDKAWAALESPYEKLKREVENDLNSPLGDDSLEILLDRHDKMQAQNRSQTKTAAMSNTERSEQKLTTTPERRTVAGSSNRQRNEQGLRSARKGGHTITTPKQGNPFAPAAATSTRKETEAAATRTDRAQRWNGIADLRKTPLAKIMGAGGIESAKKGMKQAAAGGGGGTDFHDGRGSAWQPHFSPLQSTRAPVPHRKYGSKTPAKAAADLAINDLLQSIDIASPHTRKRLVENHLRNHTSTIVTTLPGGLTSTPLRRKSRPSKSASNPTPKPSSTTQPVVSSGLSRGVQGVDSPAGISSAKLLDEDEDGRDEDARRDDFDLDADLSQLALSHSAREKLMDLDDDDDDSSGGDDDSESDDDDGGRRLSLATRGPDSHAASKQTAKAGGADYPTSSSLASQSRSIDQDTLFGIRDPHKTGSSNAKGQILSSSETKVGSASSVHVSTASDFSSSPALASVSARTGNYQPMGAHLYEQGTVYSGRPLLGDDREDTYSAPSPSPATSAQTSRKSK